VIRRGDQDARGDRDAVLEAEAGTDDGQPVAGVSPASDQIAVVLA
jgi:hypothetical protein